MNLLDKFNQQLVLVKARLEAINRFDDLREVTDMRGNVRLVSKKANLHTTDVEYQFACGCCENSALEAYPNLMINGLVRVYSDPCGIKIGTRRRIGGIRTAISATNWELPHDLAHITRNILLAITGWSDDLLVKSPFEDDMDLTHNFEI